MGWVIFRTSRNWSDPFAYYWSAKVYKRGWCWEFQRPMQLCLSVRVLSSRSVPLSWNGEFHWSISGCIWMMYTSGCYIYIRWQRQQGDQKPLPTSTGVIGYPAEGLDANYEGLCAFVCNLGYCPSGACGTVKYPLTIATTSPFLPPAVSIFHFTLLHFIKLRLPNRCFYFSVKKL